jgi:hypothetical protein
MFCEHLPPLTVERHLFARALVPGISPSFFLYSAFSCLWRVQWGDLHVGTTVVSVNTRLHEHEDHVERLDLSRVRCWATV